MNKKLFYKRLFYFWIKGFIFAYLKFMNGTHYKAKYYKTLYHKNSQVVYAIYAIYDSFF